VILQNNLYLINEAGNPPTYRVRAGTNSQIDSTLETQEVSKRIREWKVNDCVTVSDHNMIEFIYG